MAASAGRGGRFAQPRQLAPSGAVGGVAVRADGAAVVAWSRLVGSQRPVQVFGSVRAPGAATFGAPEPIGELEMGFFPPIVAFDPVGGRPTVAWGSRAPMTSPGIFARRDDSRRDAHRAVSLIACVRTARAAWRAG